MTARVVAVLFWLWLPARAGGNRIVGGDPVDITEFPFLTSLQKRQSGHCCVANLVTYKWLITAAHCVNSPFAGRPHEYVVVAGVTNLTEKGNPKEGQRGWPDRFVIHPLVRVGGTFDYDLAMVRLLAPLKESHRVRPVPLPMDALSSALLYSDNCTVAGWGNTQKVEARREDRALTKVDLPLVDTETCSEKLLRTLREHVHLCAFFEDKDACQGDSGAALICQGVQVALVSWGFGCASDYPGVYARIDTQMAWLQQVIADATSTPRPPSAVLCVACSLAVAGLCLP